METPMSSNTLSFIDALCAKGPEDGHAESMMLYGQFVGSWDGTVIVYRANGERFESTCEVHFGWALAGRAVQDVWIIPSRRNRPVGESDRMYGTTLRIYVPQDDEWQIIWSDPVRQAYDRMTGRRVGADIIQEYRNSAGAICQWCFTEIRHDSVHWVSRESVDDRSTWKLTSEFFLKRRRRDDNARMEDEAHDASHLRDFDFWIGAWRVTDRETGKELGTSRIDAILGGRAIHENWLGSDGYRGESFNIFDKDRRCWHQTWVSDNGTLLLLDGGLRDGAMDLQGKSPDGEMQRIRWTPGIEGGVLQLWETSNDGGQNWRRRFAGVYRRL
jgi:hypothetical protein